MKLNWLITCLGIIGSTIANIFGGWSTGLTVLMMFILIDFITGIVGAVLGKSDKSQTGFINSKVIWLGIFKKTSELVIVVVAAQLDRLTGSSYIRDAVVIAYIVTETVSIIENVGLLGCPIPPIIMKIIDVLKTKSENIPTDTTNTTDSSIDP